MQRIPGNGMLPGLLAAVSFNFVPGIPAPASPEPDLVLGSGTGLLQMGAQLSGRVAFWRESPFVCALLHWAAGVAHMLYISRSVATMRDALRPGVLAFLRDPSDPNFNPFRDLVEDSMLKHMRRYARALRDAVDWRELQLSQGSERR